MQSQENASSTLNIEILQMLEYCISINEAADFVKKTDVYSKITKFLKEYNNGPKDDQLPNKKLLNKFSLTKALQDIVIKLSSWLDMSKATSFDLLNGFFLKNPKLLENFIQKEQITQSANDEMKQKFEKYVTEFTEGVITFYYQERLTLIDIVIKILEQQAFFVKSDLSDFISELIKKGNLLKTLWDQFESYNKKPIRNLSSNNYMGPATELHSSQVMREQEKILDCMIMICNTVENCKKDIFCSMLRYFGETSFMCYAYVNYQDRSAQRDIISKERLIDKSILLTLLNFQPIKLFEVFRDEKSADINQLNAFAVNDEYTPFFNNNTRNMNFLPVQMTVNVVGIIISNLVRTHPNLMTQKNKYTSLQFNRQDEETINFINAMLKRFENEFLFGSKDSYFSANYKFVIKQWLNLVMEVYYKGNISEYKTQLLNLVVIVLDSPATRDEFFEYDGEKKTPIFNLFLYLLQYPKVNRHQLIKMIFSLSVPKPENDFNLSLFATLVTYDDKIPVPFFYNILQEWRTLNDNLLNGANEFIEDPRRFNVAEQLSLVALFARLFSYNKSALEAFIAMRKENGEKTIYNTQEDTEVLMEIIYKTVDTLELLTRDKEFYMIYTVPINELFNLLINLSDRERISYPQVFVNDESRASKLINTIYKTISYDVNQKEFNATVLVLKLLKKFFSLDNIVLFTETEKHKQLLGELYNFLIVLTNQFAKITSFYTPNQIKIIRIMTSIFNDLIKIITVNANHAQIITESTVMSNTISVSSEVSGVIQEASSNEIVTMIIQMINQIDITSFIFNFLQVRVRIDPTQTHTSMRYNFVNMFIEKCVTQSEFGPPGYVVALFRKMLCEIFKTFNSIMDLVLLYKKLKDYSLSAVLFNLELIKKWDFIFYKSKTIPFFISESSNLYSVYDINLIMLLFIYSNFEVDHNLYYKERKELDLNEDPLTMSQIIKNDFTRDIDVNVCPLVYCALTKILYIISLTDSANDKMTSPIFHIMSLLSMKKNSSNEIESNVNLSNNVKFMIIRQLENSDNFVRIEIIKFLTLAANTQINFTSFIMEDFPSSERTTKNIWDIISQALAYQGDPDTELLAGYVILFIAKILINDMVYKKFIKDLFASHKEFFGNILNRNISSFSLTAEMVDKLKKNLEILNEKDEIHFNEIFYLNIEVAQLCFFYIVIKNLCIIFTKLITLSEIIHNKPKVDFSFPKELSLFVRMHLVSLISDYYIEFDSDTIFNFNEALKRVYPKKNMFVGFQIKNEELPIANDINNLPFVIGDIFAYGYSYYIDIKELYLNTLYKDYNEIFNESFNSIISYNLSLSIFEAKTQAMFSMSYLLGVMFTIGPFGYAMTSSFFTNSETYPGFSNKASNDIATVDLLINNGKNIHPRLGFTPLKELFNDNPKTLTSFLNESLIKKINLSSEQFVRRGIDSSVYNSTEYSQYLVLNYNIMNFVMDYANYIFRYTNTSEVDSNFLISDVLGVVRRELSINNKRSDVSNSSNLILSMITLVYNILQSLQITGYDFKDRDFDEINLIMKEFSVLYNIQVEYRAVITYIFVSYVSIPYFTKKQGLIRNILFNPEFENEYKENIIRSIITKINESTSQTEYQSFIMLLVNIVNLYKSDGFDLIQQEKVFYYLQSKISLNDVNEYDSNERNTTHILWCWTLKFISTIILTFAKLDKEDQLKYYSVYKNSIEHLRCNEQRIFRLLSSCASENNEINSLATIEEVEMITEVLSSILITESQNKFSGTEHLDFFMQSFILLFNSALGLYVPNMKIGNIFKPHSSLEKKMEEIVLSEDESAIRKNSIYSDLSTNQSNPYARIINQKNMLNVTHSNISNLFTFRIYQILNKILFNCTAGIKFAFDKEDNFYQKNLFMLINNDTNTNLLNDEGKNILNCFYFIINFVESFSKNFKIYSSMYKKSLMFYNNISTGINLGFFNLINKPMDNKEMSKISNYTIIYLVCIAVEVNELIKLFNGKMYQSFQFETQFKENLMKVLQSVRMKIKEVGDQDRDTISFIETVIEKAKNELNNN